MRAHALFPWRLEMVGEERGPGGAGEEEVDAGDGENA